MALLAAVASGQSMNGVIDGQRRGFSKLLTEGFDLSGTLVGKENVAPTWYQGDMIQDVQNVAGILPELLSSTQSASDQEIEDAGRVLQALRQLPSLLKSMKAATGISVQGFSSLVQMDFDNPSVGALALALLVYFRRNDPARLEQFIPQFGLTGRLASAQSIE